MISKSCSLGCTYFQVLESFKLLKVCFKDEVGLRHGPHLYGLPDFGRDALDFLTHQVPLETVIIKVQVYR